MTASCDPEPSGRRVRHAPPPLSEQPEPCGWWEKTGRGQRQAASAAALRAATLTRGGHTTPLTASVRPCPNSGPRPLSLTGSHWPGVRLGVLTSWGRLRCGSHAPPIGRGTQAGTQGGLTVPCGHLSRTHLEPGSPLCASLSQDCSAITYASFRDFGLNIQTRLCLLSTFVRC